MQSIHTFFKQKLPGFTSEAVCNPKAVAHSKDHKITDGRGSKEGVQIRVIWYPKVSSSSGKNSNSKVNQ
jgi:hypothetical protein